ncbi:unnamed protein product [Effrenium voratum]|nr:unnamed protein product [Effrenium voratum]
MEWIGEDYYQENEDIYYEYEDDGDYEDYDEYYDQSQVENNRPMLQRTRRNHEEYYGQQKGKGRSCYTICGSRYHISTESTSVSTSRHEERRRGLIVEPGAASGINGRSCYRWFRQNSGYHSELKFSEEKEMKENITKDIMWYEQKIYEESSKTWKDVRPPIFCYYQQAEMQQSLNRKRITVKQPSYLMKKIFSRNTFFSPTDTELPAGLKVKDLEDARYTEVHPEERRTHTVTDTWHTLVVTPCYWQGSTRFRRPYRRADGSAEETEQGEVPIGDMHIEPGESVTFHPDSYLARGSREAPPTTTTEEQPTTERSISDNTHRQQMLVQNEEFPKHVEDTLPDHIPEEQTKKFNKRRKAVKEEWFAKAKGKNLRWHFWELFDIRYGWDINDHNHQTMLKKAYHEFAPILVHEVREQERLRDRPGLEFISGIFVDQEKRGNLYNLEQPLASAMWGQGQVNGVNRTALSAVYPQRRCHKMVTGFLNYLNSNRRMVLPKWPKHLAIYTTEHYYESIEDWKNTAGAHTTNAVELELPASITLDIETVHFLKKALLETVQKACVELRPWHRSTGEPQLTVSAALLRLSIRGPAKKWLA